MGGGVSKLIRKLGSKKERRILMLGLDGAGKTVRNARSSFCCFLGSPCVEELASHLSVLTSR